MPTGVLHLKEVDTDKITLDGTLSVSGASKLEGTIVADSTLSVGGSAKFAATETTNINVEGTLSVSGQTTIGGDIIPDTNDAYDIGSPEFKIRDMYVSDNSLWIGDTTKISNVGGSLKFRKRKTSEVPKAIIDAGASAGHANAQATADAALQHAGLSDISQMRLQHWHKFMRTLNQAARLTDIFRDNEEDYEETSASDAWKEINDTKIYTDMNVGIGTSDPDEALHIRGAIKVEDGFSLARNEGNDPSLVIDTRNFGLDETVNDLTGNEFNKYTKLYRVYGTNSQGVGQNWYWGYAQDDYTKFSLSFDGNGGNDPDIAFVFTTASELHCNKVFAALGGNADTATRLETPRKINGVDFDGTQDITIETGIQGITKPNGGNDVCVQPGKLGVGLGSPGYKLDVESLDFTVARFKQRDSGEGAGIKLENGDGYTWNVATDTDGKFGIYRDGQSFSDFSIKDGNVGVGTTSPQQKLEVHGNILLGQNDVNSFIHGGADIAMSSDTHVLIVSDANDITTDAKSDIIFGSGSAINMNTSRNFTYAQAYPSGLPRLEHMRIKPSGNVGVGTTSPQHKLEVGNGDIAIVNNSWKTTGNDNQLAGKLLFYVGGNNTERATPVASIEGYDKYAGGNYAGAMALKAHGNEVMRLMSDGSVGIGTTSPDSTLHVNGNALIGNVPAYGKYTDAQLTLGGAHNTTTNYNNDSQIKLLISGGNNDNNSPYYIMCEDENNHDLFYVKGDTTGQGSKNKMFVRGKVEIKAPDNENAELSLLGTNQGTGIVYVGQSSSHGGGIEYNGDNSPGTTGAGADRITLFRRTAGNDYWTAYNLHNSDDWRFRNNVYANNSLLSSDDRLKTGEKNIENATESLLKLKPQIYDKHQSLDEFDLETVKESGLIAQEVYYDAPELRHLVHYDKDAEIPAKKPFTDEDPTKDPDYSSWGKETACVNYQGFIAYLIQSVKENEKDKKALTALVHSNYVEIENLKKELNDEKLRINDIISRLESLESN